MKIDIDTLFRILVPVAIGISIIISAIRNRKPAKKQTKRAVATARPRPATSTGMAQRPAAAMNRTPARQQPAPSVEDVLNDLFGTSTLQQRMSQAARPPESAEKPVREKTVKQAPKPPPPPVEEVTATISDFRSVSTNYDMSFQESLLLSEAGYDDQLPEGQNVQTIHAMTRKDWQRAIILREVLGPPLSLR